MARFNFCGSRIESSLKDQSIYIRCTADVDEESVTEDSVYLLHRSENSRSKTIAPIDIFVDGHVIQLKLKDWATPGEEYVLVVQNTICGIVDDPTYKLETSILRNIKFDSEVTSEVNVISPVDFASVSSPIKISWKETGEQLEGSFYMEVATENAFYNIIRKVFISAEELEGAFNNGTYTLEYAQLEEPRQYYIRIRAQRQDGEYGRWSKVRTFVSQEESKPDDIAPVPSEPDDNNQKPGIELPDIEDLTGGSGGNMGNAAAEKHIVPKYLEDLPTVFEIPLFKEVDISEAVVKVRREAV